MNIAQLECFLAVARHLSFARAAEELSISQPAASHQIRSLEDELGGQLFRRSTRAVELTEAGKAFLTDASRIVALARRAAERFENPGPDESRPLAFGLTCGFDPQRLAAPLAKLAAETPGFRPVLFSLPCGLVTTRTEDATVDIALGFCDEEYKKEDLQFRELGKTKFCYIYDGERFASADAAPLIICHGDVLPPPAASCQEKLAADKDPAARLLCDTPAAAMTLAAAGLGAALLPELLLPLLLPSARPLPTFSLPDAEQPYAEQSDAGQPDAGLPEDSAPTRRGLCKEALAGSDLSWGAYYRSGDENPLIARLLKLLRQEL